MIKIILESIRKRAYNRAREQRVDRVFAMADMDCDFRGGICKIIKT
jgi:hypothetical protein